LRAEDRKGKSEMKKDWRRINPASKPSGDVPVQWSCRTGVCHHCEKDLISVAVHYDPEPIEIPADGNPIICCSRPHVVIGL
jgi:hypothetical protein